MKFTLKIECNECNNISEISIEDKDTIHLSEFIEDKTENSFYCSVNYSNGMIVNCSCGNYFRVFI